MKKDRLRVFVAVKIADEVKKELIPVLAELQRLPFSVKWVGPKNLHLTLAFLGYLEKDKLVGLYQAVEKSLVGISSFLVQPMKIVCFPSFNCPRVIVLGLKGEITWLERLQKGLEKSLAEEGFELKVKPAHLTLGRVRPKLGKGERIRLGKRLAGLSFSFQGKILIDRVTVFKSDLSSQGPVYTPLKEFKLSSAPISV